jgi:hypothetical protein
VSTMVTSTKITSTERESTSGPMAEFTMVSGSTTKWKGRVPSLGVMAEDMSDNIRMIRNTDKVPLSGQMAGNISESGAKESNTAKELTSKKERRDTVSGRWARESSGSKTHNPEKRYAFNIMCIIHYLDDINYVNS